MPDRRVPAIRELDPLSWLSERRIPLWLAGLTVVIATAIILTGPAAADPVVQFAALLVALAADAVMFVATRRVPRTLTWRGAAFVLALSGAGALISAMGYRGVDFDIDYWWAPIAMAITIGLLATYLPWHEQVLLGVGVLAAVTPISVVLLTPGLSVHPVAATVAILLPPLASTVLCATFSAYTVGRMRVLIDSRPAVSLRPEESAAAERRERQRLTRLTSRAVPFLADLAESGAVTAADRNIAGQLARQLRDDLVSQANATWLDGMNVSRLVVIDPDRIADRLSPSQRTLLRGTIRAVLDTPEAGAESVLVQLRRGEADSVRVAISMEAQLPEGTRTLHLRPYLLSWESTAEEIELVDKDVLRITLDLDAGVREPGPPAPGEGTTR